MGLETKVRAEIIRARDSNANTLIKQINLVYGYRNVKNTGIITLEAKL